MSCEICGRSSCSRSFHTFEEQREYDDNIGDRIEDAKDEMKASLMKKMDRLDYIEYESKYWVCLDDVNDTIDNY